MNIYFVRHGDDDENYRGGWSQLPLIDIGIEKSNKLGKFLKENIDKYRFEKIVSSDLNRTKMTTFYINQYLNLPVEYDCRFRENNNGKLAGMLNEEAIKEYPNCFFRNLKYNERFPEGESPKEFFERVKKTLYDFIQENSQNENILVVTHAGVIAIIFHIVNDIKWTNKKKDVKIGKTSISKLVIDNNKGMKFEYVNDMPHLE